MQANFSIFMKVFLFSFRSTRKQNESVNHKNYSAQYVSLLNVKLSLF